MQIQVPSRNAHALKAAFIHVCQTLDMGLKYSLMGLLCLTPAEFRIVRAEKRELI
jgi:hypothetical protein